MRICKSITERKRRLGLRMVGKEIHEMECISHVSSDKMMLEVVLTAVVTRDSERSEADTQADSILQSEDVKDESSVSFFDVQIDANHILFIPPENNKERKVKEDEKINKEKERRMLSRTARTLNYTTHLVHHHLVLVMYI